MGRNTSGGHRDFYFYPGNIEIEALLKAAMANWPDYVFQTGARSDPEWSTYWRFLYPSPEDLERIGNRDVVDRLLKNGDDIEQPRKIDHFAVFKTILDRDRFLQYLSAAGFAVAELGETAKADFSVEFNRIDRPDRIDDVTIALFRAAKDNNGEYGGWGCGEYDGWGSVAVK